MNKILHFILLHGYSFLFSWSFLSQFGLPLPAAPLFLAAGALAGMDKLQIAAVFGVGVVATFLSDVIWYEIGRYRGNRVLSLLCRISLDPDSCVQSSKRIFTRHGTRSLLVSKFIPGMNTVAPPLAGIFHMRRAKFLLFNGAGTTVFVGLFSFTGYLFGEKIEQYADGILNAGGWVGGGVLGLAAGYVLFKYLRRRHSGGGVAIPRIAPETLRGRLEKGEELLIVDVRSDLDLEADPFTLPGARHIPLEHIEKNPGIFSADLDVVFYCS